jgi:hypothetical protein
MVANLRQFLIVLLVSLQFVAPLVHAHVGEIPGRFGLHLPELEGLHAGQAQQFFSQDQTLTAEEYTVLVGSVIAPQMRAMLFTPTAFHTHDRKLPTASATAGAFDPERQLGDAAAPPWLQLSLSRAPPSA